MLADVSRAASAAEQSPHQRYLAVFDLIMNRNRELAEIFDDMRRSNALLRLASLRSHRLISGDEFARFSAATRESVESILELRSE